jgi:hydroxymethylbilane synthase
MTKLTIGTRGSDLALYQASFIQKLLVDTGACEIEQKIIKTAGYKIQHLSFDKMEGKGFFTKELEDALLSEEIDLAVHSLKDLMTSQPDGLKLGAVGYRADRRELLLINPDARDGDGLLPVKRGGTIGTSSARRKCQVAHHNPDLTIKELRGNVPTRIQKLRKGEYDAILLAAAGVRRLELDLSGLEVIELDPELFLPAPAQGILGIQIRDNDSTTESIVSQLNCDDDAAEAAIERGLLAKYDLGCSLPLGVYSHATSSGYRLKAILGIDDGSTWVGLTQIDIEGNDIDELVERAFTLLNEADQ